MENQITIIDPKEFGLEESKAGNIEKSFLPKQIETKAFTEQYESVITKELNKETFKEARDLRLKLVKVRTGIADVHKTEKAFFLASGKYVDALKNKLTLPIEQMECKLLEIEQYEAKLEAERKSALKQARIIHLEPYGTDVQFIALDEMNADQFDLLLEREKLAHEARIESARLAEVKRIADEKAENERIEAERLAEVERLDAQRLENIKLKADAEQKAIALKKRNLELRDYIVFIRDYNKLLSMPDKEYQKEFSDIKKGAELEWEYERKKQIEEAELQDKKDAEAKAEFNRMKIQADKLAKEKAEQEKAQALKDAEAKAENERLQSILKTEQDKAAKLVKELLDIEQLKIKAEQAAKIEADRLAKAPVKKRMNVWVESFEIPEVAIQNETSTDILIKFAAFKKWAKSEIDKL